MKKKMPEKTVFNMIRIVLVLPLILLMAVNMAIDAMLSGIITIISKSINYCIKSCILVIAGTMLSETILEDTLK